MPRHGPVGGPRFSRLHIQPVGGVAGDMLLAALLDLGVDEASIRDAVRSAGVAGEALAVTQVVVNGEAARAVKSIAPAREPAHRHLSDIVAVIERVKAPAPAKAVARRIFERLVDAEAAVHGGSRQDVHLHEVGQLDSILDVVGIAVALDALGNPTITCSPLPSGGGTVRTEHGVMQCPVPAVRQIAATAKVPLVPVPVDGETVTPTGIAVIATLCCDFVAEPPAGAARLGVGAGSKRFPDRPNVVRIHAYA